MTDAHLPTRYPAERRWREVDDWFGGALVAEDDALVEARRSGEGRDLGGAEVSPTQGAFLALLARTAGATRALEFGTLYGYSTIWLARAVGEGGSVVTFELDPENAAIARRNLDRAGVGDRVEVIVGPAADSAARLVASDAEPFDLVFIDADKPRNAEYLAAARALTGPGAVIVIDNVVRNGAVTDAASADASVTGVREVVAAIAAADDLEATALQTVGIKGWDGFLIARRR